MADTVNQKLSPTVNRELSIEAMISAPLVAASKANAEMLLGQTHFLLRNCFVKEQDTQNYTPIMIQMSLTKSFINSDLDSTDENYFQIQKMDFQVPLLVLLPINSLAVEKVNIAFEMEITSTVSWTLSESDNKEAKRVLQKQAQLNGKITANSSNNTESSNKYKSDSMNRMKVEVNAGTLPLPVGVLSLLDLYTKNINPVPSKVKNN